MRLRAVGESHSARFSGAHGRRGHVFQGRCKAVLIRDESAVDRVVRYVHLNPMRTAGLGLAKVVQRRARTTGVEDPGEACIEADASRMWGSDARGRADPRDGLGRDADEVRGLGAGRLAAVAVRYPGWNLAEMAREIPDVGYMALAQGVKRLWSAAGTERERKEFASRLRAGMSDVHV